LGEVIMKAGSRQAIGRSSHRSTLTPISSRIVRLGV
jgi:hypothetical protein